MINILASFTSPVHIGTTPYAFLLALPLIAIIAVVYKATKLEKIELISFVRESFLLFGSIVVFMVLTAVCVFVFMKLTIG
jgi:membrane protease YdiL (CAAX protease family)